LDRQPGGRRVARRSGAVGTGQGSGQGNDGVPPAYAQVVVGTA